MWQPPGEEQNARCIAHIEGLMMGAEEALYLLASDAGYGFVAKLAIVQQRNINNVTDYDLQIENSQSGKPYSVEEELIPRGTTVLVRRHILSLTPQRVR